MLTNGLIQIFTFFDCDIKWKNGVSLLFNTLRSLPSSNGESFKNLLQICSAHSSESSLQRVSGHEMCCFFLWEFSTSLINFFQALCLPEDASSPHTDASLPSTLQAQHPVVFPENFLRMRRHLRRHHHRNWWRLRYHHSHSFSNEFSHSHSHDSHEWHG